MQRENTHEVFPSLDESGEVRMTGASDEVRYGEMEYSLKRCARKIRWLKSATGNDPRSSALGASNELNADVSFQKKGGPAGDLDTAAEEFAEQFAASRRNLARVQCCLFGTGRGCDDGEAV